jgi:hypothetical protein
MVGFCRILPYCNANIFSGKVLNCNIHTCPQSCHQLQDHSKMDCKAIISSKCPKNHKLTRKCHDKAAALCRKCEAKAKAAEKRRQRDYKLDQDRQAKQQAYAARLIEIEDEIEHQKRILSDRAKESDRQNALAQKRQDLLNLKNKAKQPVRAARSCDGTQQTSPTSQNSIVPNFRSATPQPDPGTVSSDRSESTSDSNGSEKSESQPDWDKSEAKDDWKDQKELWGAENKALDALMSMIGQSFAHPWSHLLTICKA